MQIPWLKVSLLAVPAALVVGHVGFIHAFHSAVSADGMTISDVSQAESLERLDALAEGVAEATPFEEIDPLDDEAMSWSNMTSQYSVGAVLFDADGDGRTDIYLPQDGRNWTRATDETGLLMDAPRHQRNMLYMNRGNDADGRPIFQSVDQLATNETFSREELLVEDFLFPRDAPGDPVDHPGRQGMSAVAADFDGNGLPDLLVGNVPPGMLWSDENTQRVLGRFAAPSGREARESKVPLTPLGQFLVDYTPGDDSEVLQETDRGQEAPGANSLFLNMGDADGDGAPEWRDVSADAGIQGWQTSSSLAVADVDLDGDLDIYVANVMDMDFWPGGSKAWAGGVNRLYINQLAQTGSLRFEERAGEMGADGRFDDDYPMPDYYRLRQLPLLPQEYSVMWGEWETYHPPLLEIDGATAEPAEISWSTIFQDVNGDRYPDIWVANDLGFLRLYINRGGERFEDVEHARSDMEGSWMALAAADFDGDLQEDLFGGSLGSGLLVSTFGSVGIEDMIEPNMTGNMVVQQYETGNYNGTHALFDGADYTRELDAPVQHSAVLPPDAALPDAYVFLTPKAEARLDIDLGTLQAYEFIWGLTSLDVQNDGRTDLYFVGGLYNRGGGLFSLLGTCPGRLLINETEQTGQPRFADLTAEHHVFNIEELQYDRLETEGYIYRRSPRQNWGRRDVVYSYDQSSLIKQGLDIRNQVRNQDLIQTAEQGRGAAAADLNGDGFKDLLVRNIGGYDSRRSDSTNLMVEIDGQRRALPTHDYNYDNLTNFEPGRTRIFLNRYDENRWLRVELVDDAEGSFNRDAVGAEVVVDGAQLGVVRAGSGGYGAHVLEPLLFGLGQGEATSIEVRWPDAAGTVTRLDLPGYADGTLEISKTQGLVAWRPAGDAEAAADTASEEAR